jgi:chemotaxis protein histidine kinase CheA
VTYALVQEIGGQISVQSELGKGTHFHIRLPLKMEPKDSKNTCGSDHDG